MGKDKTPNSHKHGSSSSECHPNLGIPIERSHALGDDTQAAK